MTSERMQFETALKKTEYKPTAHEADAMYNGWLLHKLQAARQDWPSEDTEKLRGALRWLLNLVPSNWEASAYGERIYNETEPLPPAPKGGE